jgi:hypothetical protein
MGDPPETGAPSASSHVRIAGTGPANSPLNFDSMPRELAERYCLLSGFTAAKYSPTTRTPECGDGEDQSAQSEVDVPSFVEDPDRATV